MAVDMKYGVFSWNELMSKDIEGSKAFYTKLLGWQAEDMATDGGPYTIFKVGDEQVGGLMQMPPDAAEMGAQTNWGAYISVEDTDAVVRTAEELGAKVLMAPTDIPDIGRFATLMDPQGAVISVLQPVMK